MTANTLTAELLIAIPKEFPGTKIWRQNTGSGVGMNAVKNAISCISSGRIQEGLGWLRRPIKFGIVGGGDLSGIFPVRRQGQVYGLRLEVEVKVKDKQSQEQRDFEVMVGLAGGIYVVCHNVEECLEQLRRWV